MILNFSTAVSISALVVEVPPCVIFLVGIALQRVGISLQTFVMLCLGERPILVYCFDSRATISVDGDELPSRPRDPSGITDENRP